MSHMRRPERRRSRKRAIHRPPPDIDLRAVAEAVAYEGSSEHRDYYSALGPSRLRPDASSCPRNINQATAQEWLRTAIGKGATGELWEEGFPRYAWYKTKDTVFEARLTNRGNGSYKGFPLEVDEWPSGIEEIYG